MSRFEVSYLVLVIFECLYLVDPHVNSGCDLAHLKEGA